MRPWIAVCGDSLLQFVPIIDVALVVLIREDDGELRFVRLAMSGSRAAEELIHVGL